jgi:PAS domain S-box-containing protein|nr:PAS domain S-box protein [uncultured Desulfobacter sp.]
MNNEFMESLIEQNPDAIIFADIKGTIQVWNMAAEHIFGFSKEEAVGASLDIIIPENLRKAHWRGFQQAIQIGKTKYAGKFLPTKSLHADGSVIYVDLGFSIVLDFANNVIGALSSVRDITTKYKEDRAIRKRLSELENIQK